MLTKRPFVVKRKSNNSEVIRFNTQENAEFYIKHSLHPEEYRWERDDEPNVSGAED